MSDQAETNQSALDSTALKQQLLLQAVMPRVASEFEKPLSKQIKDILKLCLRGHKLSIDEYYNMRLFDDATYSDEEKKAFVGLQKSRKMWVKLMEPNSFIGMIDDKLAYEVMMRGFGFSVPTTLGMIGGHYPTGVIEKIEDAVGLSKFLSQAKFPLFGKPVNSNQSLGSARFESCDGVSVVLSTGNSVLIKDLWDEIENQFGGQYLFQECVQPHADMKAICGSSLPTIRVVTLDRGNGPELYRCVIKLIGENNVADNFWRQGNLIAPVDLETGELGKALTQMGIDGEFVSHHPANGAAIEGVRLPHWEDVKKLSQEAAGMMASAVILGFDIALTPQGPMIIEVNADPHLIMMQIAHKKGVLDDHMLAALAYVDEKENQQIAKNKAILAKERADAKNDMKEAVATKAA